MEVFQNHINEVLDAALKIELSHLENLITTEWLTQTESTNDDVKFRLSQEFNKRTIVVVADMQTGGKGTHGRVWITPKASMLLTLGVPIDYSIMQARGLTLAIGAQTVDILYRYNKKVKLKWPNDVWIDGRKVCGISCETAISADKQLYVVVGIGINIALDENAKSLLNSSCYIPGAIYQEEPNKEMLTRIRLELATQLIENCRKEIIEFSSTHLGRVCVRWQELDAFADQKVKFITPNGKTFEGFIDGVDQYGQLRLDCGDRIREFVDGTLRPLI